VQTSSTGWHILLYHDVSWEENCYVRSIGGTIPPDVFRTHVAAAASLGELVSVPDGERRLAEGALDGPIFSFWFDDGLAGVARHAAPILGEYGVSGAVSICSRFVNRTEFFWRFKLSYLSSIDGMRFLRTRLKKHGLERGAGVRVFTQLRFSPDVLRAIDELFERFTTPAQRADAFRMFMDPTAIGDLARQGWTIANHTASHYPVAEENCAHLLVDQFHECETEIMSIVGAPSRYWVLPFGAHTPAAALRAAESVRMDRRLVFVGDRVNTIASSTDGVLYRFIAPTGSAARLVKLIGQASPGGGVLPALS
jgi:peptidoglycan/xylan/chitin deacetylase (PgdA/CDA1 family)